MTSLLLVACLLAEPASPQAAEIAPAPEAAVTALVEDLRKAELMLDTETFEGLLARSFTFVEERARLSGPFAYLEPMRQLKGRKGIVKELRFDELMIRVFGASAVATYRLSKTTVDQGVKSRQEGWSSDVFEKRDDGAWLLVHRHRP